MSCIILHVSIYINQPEVEDNLMVTNFLEGLAFNNFEFCPHSVFVFCTYLRTSTRLFPHKGLTYEFLQTIRKAFFINPLNPELNPLCYLLALLGAHHFLHVSRIRVKLLTFRLLMSYIHGAPILDVSRSHTKTQHSR